jgi:hypothetical protein
MRTLPEKNVLTVLIIPLLIGQSSKLMATSEGIEIISVSVYEMQKRIQA